MRLTTCKRGSLEGWIGAFLFLLSAYLLSISSCVWAAGGPVKPSNTPQDVTITKLRIGTYPTYTRVVLETTTPLEWSVLEENNEGVRIVVPGGFLAPGIQALGLRKGILRAIQPTQRAGGAEVKLVPHQQHLKVRTFSLSDPDRIVVDVLTSPAGEANKELTQSNSNLSPQDSVSSIPPVPLAPPIENRATSTGKEAGAETLSVVLDPGHGGHDTGAVGPTGLMEKDVVLDLALRLRRLLQERLGVRVILTRDQDVFVPLQERSAIANRAKADFYVSLHVNGSPKRGAVGFETFYFTREPSDNDARASAQRENLLIDRNGSSGKDQESLLRITLADMAVTRDIRESGELAELALSSLDKIMKVENRGVKSGPFYVLATVAMPAVLVESAFITNSKEERKLQRDAYRQRIAEALCEAIGKYKARYERRVGLRGGASTATGS